MSAEDGKPDLFAMTPEGEQQLDPSNAALDVRQMMLLGELLTKLLDFAPAHDIAPRDALTVAVAFPSFVTRALMQLGVGGVPMTEGGRGELAAEATRLLSGISDLKIEARH